MPAKQKRNTRVFRRTATQIPVTLWLPDEQREAQTCAAVQQISFHGIRVVTNVGLKRGQDVRIVRMTGPYSAVPARVVWVSALDSNQQRQAGLQFTDPLRSRISPN